MIHVVIVDDHALVRAGLTAVFEKTDDMRVVGAFSDGATFLSGLARIERVDVVLLDVTMPKTDGMAVLERLRARRNPPRTIMLSMHPARSHAQRAVDAGAHGYVTKDAEDATVLEAVRTVAWGGLYFSDTGTELLMREGTEPASDDVMDRLSDQERRVFRLLYMGLTTKEIARDLDLSPKTVSTYKSRLMAKLGVANMLELIRFAVEHEASRDET